MSGFEAIAGLSTTLRNLLRDRMENPINITIAPPDVVIPSMDGERANLYLYQVNENGNLKNQEIPGEGHPGAYGYPPLSLNLSYLITAHGASSDGADADLQAQQVLGDLMRVFHEYPILTEELHENDDPGDPLILDPSLVGEFERIKITLQPNHLEELSKIWTALPATAFRRSVIYHVSVVQIESRRRRRSPLPVRRRAVYAFPLQSPFIDEAFRDPPFGSVRNAVVEVGDKLVLSGRNLAGASTRVRIGEVTVNVPAPQPRRIELTVQAGLTAGAHTVQVIHDLPLEAETGQPPVLHRGFESNVFPILVLPDLQAINPPAAAADAVVTVTIAPPAAADQSRSLLLGDFEIAGEPVAVDSPPTANLDFRLPTGAAAVPPDTYLARVRVDGAESRLSVNPMTGAYDGPHFTVNP